MKITRFEDVIAWQKAKALAAAVRKESASISDRSYKDQIFRASLSTMNNIAEGFDRATDKELKHFLHTARGSNAEVRSMLLAAVEFDYITHASAAELINLSEEISKLLSGFIKFLTTDYRLSKTLTDD